MTSTKRAVGIDFGRKGLAYCVADLKSYPPTIISLSLEPDVGPINTAKLATAASVSLFNKLPNITDYLLEAQPAINRQTLMLECSFAGAARAAAPASRVHHIQVSTIKREFALPTGHAEKKKAATRVACTLLTNPEETVLAYPGVLDCVLSSDRKHDMADAMLMVMWYARKLHGKLRHPTKKA